MGRERGMTLVELVISIVVVSIAVSAVLAVLTTNVEHSADAMIVSQAVSVAEGYLEEISAKSFDDPDGMDGEASRADFDDVDDFDGLADVGAVDQFGNPIPSLVAYNVAVSVTPSGVLPSVPAGDALRIDVRVTQLPYVDFTLSAYRARF